jgi:hypothetical protein
MDGRQNARMRPVMQQTMMIILLGARETLLGFPLRLLGPILYRFSLCSAMKSTQNFRESREFSSVAKIEPNDALCLMQGVPKGAGPNAKMKE